MVVYTLRMCNIAEACSWIWLLMDCVELRWLIFGVKSFLVAYEMDVGWVHMSQI